MILGRTVSEGDSGVRLNAVPVASGAVVRYG